MSLFINKCEKYENEKAKFTVLGVFSKLCYSLNYIATVLSALLIFMFNALYKSIHRRIYEGYRYPTFVVMGGDKSSPFSSPLVLRPRSPSELVPPFLYKVVPPESIHSFNSSITSAH